MSKLAHCNLLTSCQILNERAQWRVAGVTVIVEATPLWVQEPAGHHVFGPRWLWD
jgi:hypothetical protein